MRRCCTFRGAGVFSGPLWQEGGAIRGFSGPEWQVGGGFNFGRFLWKHAKPLLGFLSKQALKTGVEIGQDVLSGENIKESAKNRLKETGKTIANKAIDKAKEKIAGAGSGIKRRAAMPSGIRKRRRSKKTINVRKGRVSRKRVTRIPDIFDNE
jgi:hypothetical protein